MDKEERKGTEHGGMEKKNRRGRGGKKQKDLLSKKLILCGANANGIKSKKESFFNLLETYEPHVFLIQETKLSRKNQVRVKGYDVFEKVRKNKGGGGVMIAIKDDILTTPVEVSPQEDDEVEILTVEIELQGLTLRILTAYGPQEEENDDKINKFYCTLENEIVKCQELNCGLIIEMDCNAKLGKEVIQGDPHDMSNNGKLLWDIVQRRDCVVVNSLSDKCNGVITRSRMKSGVLEQSVIDFVIVNSVVAPYVECMEIDELKAKTLTRYRKGVAIPSDHNLITCTLNIPLQRKRQSRDEFYRIRSEKHIEVFKERTTKTTRFTECFLKKGDVRIQGRRWLKVLMKMIHVCFEKVRIRTNKKHDPIQQQLDERRKMKIEIGNATTARKRHDLEDKLHKIEKEISDKCETKNCSLIEDQIHDITNKDGSTNNAGVWRLRKKLFPKPAEHMCGKKDRQGNLITNPTMLKQLYLDAYTERLEHRKMIPELLKLKTLREELFQQRLQLSKSNKSPMWTMDDLDKVLSRLKSKKAADPTGLANEIFMLKNIGDDLKSSILLLMNKIKEQIRDPEFMELANVTSFWKGKGPRDDIDFERGIFILSVLKMIKDRLVYNDIRDVISMSDSQVARKDYSIRNHLFIIYSAINSAVHHESPPIDIHLYDLCKCFDGLWLEECCNNLFEAGVKDDKLALIYESNKVNQVAVKTPGGLTERATIKQIVMQGGVTGPVCCSVQTDMIGKDALINNEYLYMYKGTVGIPSLAMVDDVAKISVCGTPAVVDNAYINARIEQDKQLFNGGKCHGMHVGRQLRPCSVLKAHSSNMDIVMDEKYVGDIVSRDGKHTKNIIARKSKIFKAPVSTPATALYLDTGCIPIPYIIKMKRIMYLHHILTRSEDALITRAFWAQVGKPVTAVTRANLLEY